MVNIMKPPIDKMLSSNQKGFVEGRHILDVVIVAHELIHSIENNKKPAMVLKLDISKAYDIILGLPSWSP